MVADIGIHLQINLSLVAVIISLTLVQIIIIIRSQIICKNITLIVFYNRLINYMLTIMGSFIIATVIAVINLPHNY